MGILYANNPDSIAKVVAACNRAFDRGEPIGLDTEFYGVEVGRESTVARARLHLLSVAVKRWPHQLSPRGYHVADAAVFTEEALRDRGLRQLLESPGEKCVHNLPVDAHTLQNAGVRLGGGINTLALARWAWPHRARGRGFTLDALGEDIVGFAKTEDFRELFSETVTEYRSTFRRVRACECGANPCKRRSSTPGHARIETMAETKHPKEVVRPVPLESVVPGHRLWNRAVAYSAADALLALAIFDLAYLEMRKEIEVPWLKA